MCMGDLERKKCSVFNQKEASLTHLLYKIKLQSFWCLKWIALIFLLLIICGGFVLYLVWEYFCKEADLAFFFPHALLILDVNWYPFLLVFGTSCALISRQFNNIFYFSFLKKSLTSNLLHMSEFNTWFRGYLVNGSSDEWFCFTTIDWYGDKKYLRVPASLKLKDKDIISHKYSKT